MGWGEGGGRGEREREREGPLTYLHQQGGGGGGGVPGVGWNRLGGEGGGGERERVGDTHVPLSADIGLVRHWSRALLV